MIDKTRLTLGRPHWLLPFCALYLFVTLFSGLAPGVRAQSPPFSGEEMFRGLILAHGRVADAIPEIRDQLELPGQLREEWLRRGIEQIQDRLIAAIRVDEPGFFESFAAAMRSGDHLRIGEELNRAGRATLRALSRMPEIAALRRELAVNPAARQRLQQGLEEAVEARSRRDDRIDPQAALRLVEGLIAQTFNEESAADPEVTSASVVVVLVAVAAVVAAITFAIASAYVGALNVALAVNVYATIFAWSGGGTTEPRRRSRNSYSLTQEQLIDSIALRLAA